ncbi:MAG: glutamate--tRNA ligase [Candidatus Pacebacteria bacterium]|nr:glutamate--tRNA ligase [Candidatus Paceibacterota bacterium]
MKVNDTENKVVVRIPPSPTGNLHLGTARTALFNYLFAKQNGGEIIFRLEDTDLERSKEEFTINIVDGLNWLGINWDNEQIYKQSERGPEYKIHLEKIIASGHAYISKEEVKEEGQRAEVIRFKNPNKVITFQDAVRGDITFDTTELGDFVIAKSLDEPIYHFAVVADDFDMGVTHVIRGEDGISNTPRQILIQEALGAPRPVYAHLPLILGPDKSKLSKRHGAASISEYRSSGFTKEAIINYLAFLGWNPGTEQEIFTLEELIKEFSLEKVQKSGAVFNIEKLKWYNKEYLKKENPETVIAEIKNRLAKSEINPEMIEKIAPTLIERINVYSDIEEILTAGDLDLYISKPQYEKEKLLWKKSPDLNESKEHLEKVHELLSTVSDWNAENIKSAIWPYADEKGKGNVLWPLRYSLSGKDQSPDPIEIASVLGKEETLNRINFAVQLINA